MGTGNGLKKKVCTDEGWDEVQNGRRQGLVQIPKPNNDYVWNVWHKADKRKVSKVFEEKDRKATDRGFHSRTKEVSLKITFVLAEVQKRFIVYVNWDEGFLSV